jgi:uncharacterized protein
VSSPLEQTANGVRLYVRAMPKSGRNAIAGVRDGRLIVRVTAAPEDGKANAAILKLLAKTLGLAPSDIEVVSGATMREKTLLLRGADLTQISAALNL